MTKHQFSILLDEQSLTKTMAEYNPQILDLNLHNDVEEVVGYGSGGGFYHLFLRLSNGHVVSFHYDHGDVEYSYNTFSSVDDYIDTAFGFEYDLPNYDQRFATFDTAKTLFN